MSASEPESKIDLLDSAEDVRRKIKKAFCEPGNVVENGVLAFVQHVIFPVLEDQEFVVQRPEKYGGNATFSTYMELEKAYEKEEVYPLDLKNAVARELNKLLEPIRQKFASSPELQNIRDLAYPEEKLKEPAEGRRTQKEATAASSKAVDISRLDIRIGHVVSAEKHPDADTLYIQKIDVGEVEPRMVVSSLANYLPLDALQDRMVVVLCNLKPVNMRGVKSNAMLLAAASGDRVEPLDPPPGCKPGDRVYVEGYELEKLGGPYEVLDPKKKFFEQIQPELQTSPHLIATYRGVPLQTTQGEVTVKTLISASIQ